MKLITWNIQWGRGAVDGRVDLERIVRDAHALAPDFDVLCLQEVSAGHDDLDGCDGRDQFAALAALLPGFTAVAGAAVDVAHPSADGRRQQFGNLILSRLPVDAVQRLPLPWPADAGATTMQRLLLEATVRTPRGPLRVATTHLEYFSPVQRMAQVEALRDAHRAAVARARCAAPSGKGPFRRTERAAPMILCGDFNYPPQAPEHARMTAAIDPLTPALVDAWHRLHPHAPHPPSVGLHDKMQWPDPAFCCDYVFVSADLAPRLRAMTVDARSTASDHQPLLVEFDAG